MWTIEFHRKAIEEIAELSEQAQEKITSLLDRIKTVGFSLVPKKNYKHIVGDIWELRTTSRDGEARSLYVTKTGKILKILVVFAKKTQKTPMGKIELAERRKDDEI